MWNIISVWSEACSVSGSFFVDGIRLWKRKGRWNENEENETLGRKVRIQILLTLFKFWSIFDEWAHLKKKYCKKTLHVFYFLFFAFPLFKMLCGSMWYLKPLTTSAREWERERQRLFSLSRWKGWKGNPIIYWGPCHPPHDWCFFCVFSPTTCSFFKRISDKLYSLPCQLPERVQLSAPNTALTYCVVTPIHFSEWHFYFFTLSNLGSSHSRFM